MGLPDSVTNLLDRAWLRAKTTAGLCAPSAATVETYLKKGEQYTERAYYVTELTNVDSDVLETMGISGFFSGMEQKLNPESRWKRQFDEIDRN